MRSSASESTSSSAPGGWRPSQPSTTSVDHSSTQISGRNSVKNARTGAERASAVPSEWPSATPFGTSSPMTTCRYVRIRYAIATASADASHVSNAFESACSPSAPMPSEVLEMGQRLGDGETALRGAELGAEDGQRDVVAGLGLWPKRRARHCEATLVVPDQIARAAGRVPNRPAVPWVHDPRRELDRALERREIVAERVR